MSPAERIVIDPENVRALATRMRGGAFIFSNSGRTMAQGVLPPMPGNLAAHVSEAICEVNAALQDLAVELIEDAVHLEARATWAELGGGAGTAWLIPGLRRYPSLPDVPTSPVAEVPDVTEEQIRAGQEWAIEMLDGMPETRSVSNGETDRLHADAMGAIETDPDELPIKPLGHFTLAAEGVDFRRQGSAELVASVGPAAGGAIGSGLGALLASPTGGGILGCLITGGLLGTDEEFS